MSLPAAKILVVQQRPSRVVFTLQHLSFWVLLIGAIAVSRIWLGGSFIVELIATFFTLVVLSRWIIKTAGIDVLMEPAEVRRWLDDGAPRDVIRWRLGRES